MVHETWKFFDQRVQRRRDARGSKKLTNNGKEREMIITPLKKGESRNGGKKYMKRVRQILT